MSGLCPTSKHTECVHYKWALCMYIKTGGLSGLFTCTAFIMKHLDFALWFIALFFTFCMFHVRTFGHIGRTKKKKLFLHTLHTFNFVKYVWTWNSFLVIPSHTPALLPCCFFPFCSFAWPLTSRRTISSQKRNFFFFPIYGLCNVITGNMRQLCCMNPQQWSYRKCDFWHVFIWRETDCP